MRLAEMTALERLALRLCLEAPEKRSGDHTPNATVRWETIIELRAELERLGFNWRAGVKERKRLENENRRANYAARLERNA